MNEFKLKSKQLASRPTILADSSPESNFDSDDENIFPYAISTITFIQKHIRGHITRIRLYRNPN